MSEIDLTGAADNLEDMVGEDMRLGLLVASQLAERLSSQLAERRRQEENMAERDAAAARQEFEANRSLARGATAGVENDKWWQDATPAQIQHSWTLARGWEGHDELMAQRAEQMRQGLMDRYGVGRPDAMTLTDLMEARREHAAQAEGPVNDAEWQAREYAKYAEELRAQQENVADYAGPAPEGYDQERWQRDNQEVLKDLENRAEALSDNAHERAERLRSQGTAPAQSRDWEHKYDTPERRTQLREQLNKSGVQPEAADARHLADVSQGKPAADAVRGNHKEPKAKRGRRFGRGRDRQNQRGR